METEKTNTGKIILKVAIITGLLLLLPYLAMQLNWQIPDPGSSQSGGVNWSLADFIIMGTLLMSAGLTYELVIKRVSDRTRRILLTLGIMLAFLLVWAELAVGVFGSPFAGN